MGDTLAMSGLDAYRRFEFGDGRWTRPLYRRGEGPGVIVIHEIPGLHPLVVRFADRVAAAGMSVYLPSLFGTPGKPMSMGCAATEMIKAICISARARLLGITSFGPRARRTLHASRAS